MNVIRTTTWIRTLVIGLTVAAISLASHSAHAALVTLTDSDGFGASSFASPGNWSDGQPPTAGNDYQVTSGRNLRNGPNSTGTVTFAGDSLTLGDGTTAGVLIFKNLSGAVVNIDNLTLNNGEIQAGGDQAGVANSTTLGGSITLGPTASRFHSGGSGRSIIVDAPISGSGNVSFINNGWTQLTNAGNSYTGTSTVTGGMLRAADGISLPTASNLILNGGILGTEADFTRSFGTGAGQVQLGSGTVGFAAFGTTRNVNLDGGSSLIWGTAPFNIGTLILSHSTSDATVVFQNAIDLGASTRTIHVENGSAELDAEISGALISTGGGLTKTGAGTLVVSSANNTYSGTTTIGANSSNNRIGVIRATATQALGTGLVIPGIGGNDATARLELEGGISLPNNFDLPGRNNATVAIQNVSGNNTLAGSILLNSGGSTYAIQSDAGLLTLSGASLANNNGTGTRTFTLTGGGDGLVTALINNGTTGGSTALIKDGGGTWTLANNNSYAGSTTVNNGTLLVNGNNSAATGAVTVSANGTLGGTGTIGGATTVNGNLAPGVSAGLLNLSSSLTLAGTTSMEIDGLIRGVAGGYDAVNVGTALIYGGTLNLAFSTTFGLQSFNLFDAALQTGDFSAINLTGAYNGSLSSQGAGLWTGTIAGQYFQFTTSDGVLLMIPEPGSLMLIVLGLVAFALSRTRGAVR